MEQLDPYFAENLQKSCGVRMLRPNRANSVQRVRYPLRDEGCSRDLFSIDKEMKRTSKFLQIAKIRKELGDKYKNASKILTLHLPSKSKQNLQESPKRDRSNFLIKFNRHKLRRHKPSASHSNLRDPSASHSSLSSNLTLLKLNPICKEEQIENKFRASPPLRLRFKPKGRREIDPASSSYVFMKNVGSQINFKESRNRRQSSFEGGTTKLLENSSLDAEKREI